ncbi:MULTISPECIES: YetF domain-containing protein [Pelosinus]|uniref:YetF C-terminal domain-containing protein n=1 Tax=Pelosinus fermentans B4 TaxID=1149862 RepID=I9LH79_9FIRM|nr:MULTISPECIES: DUF421 domain-containing protein [Pelosinus]EIW19844.1 protein of unknown function DUF421 [Pelosinus fermentans B4]EIW21299.1 protein of unknown function DUF421 [Pelosinus fermentans A11]OAM94998.1 protein of unknown function DUF421 [Pelosinus fermentans DSM 17108]SDR21773.1 Uncharacterized membrane protein YcaP, DUF421 family [Pelosinus fermentans]
MIWNDFLRDTWQTTLIFVTLLILTRLLDKTQVGQLTLYEYVSGITIGSLAATIASSDPDKVWSDYYDLLLFAALTYIVSICTMKSRPFRKLIEGSPSILIENGRIIKENMKSLRFDMDELNTLLRGKDIVDISEIQYAILETTGEMSIIKKSGFQPLTKSDMNIHLPDPLLPVELIMDGEIIEENLKKQNLTHIWLEEQLSSRNIKNASHVMYGVIDSKGQLFISAKGSHQD